VSVRRGKTSIRRGGARALSRLATFVAALALFGQLLALPYHRPQTASDLSAVAASLKATFGDNAILCVQADEGSPSAPERRHSHGDEGCPLCQFAAQMVLFAAPIPAAPERLDVAVASLTARADFTPAGPAHIGLPPPRGPPLEV
jgi:hypothetical protein